MEAAGYILIAIAALAWFYLMISEMINVFPEGIIGLIAIVGLGILFVKVLAERLLNREDDHYDHNVDQ